MNYYYYAIRTWNSNSGCTGRDPVSGRVSKKVEVSVFGNVKSRDEWLSRENLAAHSVNGGGVRIPATRDECRKICAGLSKKDFEIMIASKINKLEHE